MPLTKLVNGKRVEVDPAEEAEILAEWAASAAEPVPFPDLSRPTFFKTMIIDLGVTEDQARQAISALPEAERIDFRHSQRFSRDHPLVSAVATALGLAAEDIDAAWRAAPKKYESKQ